MTTKLTTLTIIFLFFVTQKGISQNNIYIVTEKYAMDGGFYTYSWDSVFVSTPTGLTTAYSLPNYLSETRNHDSQLSSIINSITALGYKNVSNNDWTGTLVYANNCPSCTRAIGVIKTMIFAQP